MADSRFHGVAGPFTLKELAELCGADVLSGDENRSFSDVAPLDFATPEQVSFLDNKKYIQSFEQTKAGCAIVHPDLASRAPDGIALLTSQDPYRSYAMIARAFYPLPKPTPAIAKTAFVDTSATIGEGCRIEPGAFIGAGAEIGNNCHIGPNAVIGEGVVIGDGGSIGPNASILCALIGERVIIHGGVRIGQDGFGFAMGAEHLKVPQLGRVIVGDDVEIGANSCIDRGTGPDTKIGDGTKIDNLVQIAHNVELGRGCVIVSHVGISGSTKVGNYVVMGGQVGVAGHLNIGDGAQLAAKSGVMRDIPPGMTVGGSPSQPMKEWLRSVAMIEKMVKKKRG